MKKILLIIIAATLFSVPFLFVSKQKEQRRSDGEACKIVVNVEGIEMPLEQYVIGVVSAEMPAAYELEALKAQAIAARTYALYKQQDSESLKTSVLHQVFYDAQVRRERWVDDFEHYEQKVTDAVEETAGQVMRYDGQLISAMFHAASNGHTESALNYSGNDIPYLRSVSSPEKEKTEQIIADSKWSAQALLAADLQRNESGRVERVVLADETLSGRELREALQLRSTDFQFAMKNGKLMAVTRGYGHGVGMSQQGAQHMALAGATAIDILQHYYSGVDIELVSCED